jgi:hypothetical protein
VVGGAECAPRAVADLRGEDDAVELSAVDVLSAALLREASPP